VVNDEAIYNLVMARSAICLIDVDTLYEILRAPHIGEQGLFDPGALL
jgi:hypothetical protein